MAEVHATAIVHSAAELGDGVRVGAYASVGPKVILHDNVVVHSHAIVEGKTTVGKGSEIFPFASIGMKPQDLKYAGEDTELIIGENNQIREYSNISIGTKAHGCTRIGSNNLFMIYTHIAHDCLLGDHIIVANGVSIAGHVEIHDRAVIGGMAGIHQFARVGTMAMIAAGAMVAQDVPPYCMVQGDRAKPIGLNVVGLRRAELSPAHLSDLKFMYRAVFEEGLTIDDALAKIEKSVEASVYRDQFFNFLRKTERGICR